MVEVANLKNVNYSNLIIGILVVFAAGYVYDKFKIRVAEDDRAEEVNIIKKYLLNERDDYMIEKLSSIKKPILWIPVFYAMNSRKWESFGSRNSTELNQDYLYLTIRSIINQCGEDFHIVMLDDDSFKILLEEWTIDLGKLGDAQLANFRLLALAKVLHKYGGIVLEPSFILFKTLMPIWEKIAEGGKMVTAEFANRSSNSHIMTFMPSTKFMGCAKACPIMHAFVQYLGILFSTDYTNQLNIENAINKWLLNKIQNGDINYIGGEYLGTKDSSGKLIDLERLMSSNYLDLNKQTYGLYIPQEDLLKRTNYNWFVYLNSKEVLESNTNLGKYLLISNN